MTEGYLTAAELQAAKLALIESMPELCLPAAYALGYQTHDGEIRFPVLNHRGQHYFPAVALAKVLGYRSGTTVVEMSRDDLDEAIKVLEPAGACADYEHPNLRAWEGIRTELAANRFPEGIRLFAVFVADEGDPASDPRLECFRRELGLDDRV